MFYLTTYCIARLNICLILSTDIFRKSIYLPEKQIHLFASHATFLIIKVSRAGFKQTTSEDNTRNSPFPLGVNKYWGILNPSKYCHSVFFQNLYCTIQVFFSDEYVISGISRNGENRYVFARQEHRDVRKKTS